MPGIAQGIPGARAFDEMHAQRQIVQFRNRNDGEPPENRVVLEPQSVEEFKLSVMRALGVGRLVTGQG